MRLLFISILLFSIPLWATDFGAAELGLSRQALAEHQFRGMTGLLRMSLEKADRGGPVEKEALAFAEQVYTMSNGHAFYPEFLLPEAVDSVELVFATDAEGHLSAEVRMAEVSDTPIEVELKRESGERLLHLVPVRRGGPGHWSAIGTVSPTQSGAGLFRLNVFFKSRDDLRAWFIAPVDLAKLPSQHFGALTLTNSVR